MPGSKKTVLVFSKRKNLAATQSASELKSFLEKKGFNIMDPSETDGRISAADLGSVALGVVIGGDGTFLTLIRRLDRKDLFPMLGVNLGSLGFITEFHPDKMKESVELALAGKFKEEERHLLQVEICRGDVCEMSGTIFNDAVLTKDAKTPMLKFRVSLGGELLSQVRADGYIVATPTGSTAYGLSAGGPLLHPSVDAAILVPICAHALSSRPVVIPIDLSIEIQLGDLRGSTYLVFDGQVSHELTDGVTVRIRPSKAKVRLIRSPSWNWSETIREKLAMH